jgi:dTDP-4-amino-4,6-dideoxygalactose transaminase
MTTKTSFIPFALPDIGEEEVTDVVETLRSGWLTTGKKTAAFEAAFAQTVGSKHALAVNSATAGLHLALDAVGVTANDLVLTTPWTFTATAEVIRYLGAHPVFADIDPITLNVSVPALQRVLEERSLQQPVRAVVPVHIAGLSCNMQEIMDLAHTNNLKVVEDAAHAFPATAVSRSVDEPHVVPRNIGTIGHATVFSFYATKTITTGEGGMLTTSDPEIARRVKLMRLHGISRDVWDRYQSSAPNWFYEVVEPGFKYNLTDIASAIGIQQLKKAARFQQRRADIAMAYTNGLRDIPELALPPAPGAGVLHSWHLYILRLNLAMLRITRDQFIEEMALRGIGCSVHFIPLHLHPYWRDQYKLTPEMFPVATREFQRVVSLPIYTKMDESSVARVIDTVRDIIAHHRR